MNFEGRILDDQDCFDQSLTKPDPETSECNTTPCDIFTHIESTVSSNVNNSSDVDEVTNSVRDAIAGAVSVPSDSLEVAQSFHFESGVSVTSGKLTHSRHL